MSKMPGKYEYKAGMRVKDIIKDSTALLKETYLDYAPYKEIKAAYSGGRTDAV